MNTINNTNAKGGSDFIKPEPFTEDERATIQAKLEKKLGPEYVSTRPGGGGVRVSYIEGWKAINLANQIFGYDGWFSEVKNVQVDFFDDKGGKFNVGLSMVVRVVLKSGSYHEDIGYGSCENARTKAMAFEKAKKEAMTDGLKRALRCFGNAMGNCLYDKEYLSKISAVKCAPPDFDESNLMRFTDHVNSRPATIPAKLTSDSHVNNSNSLAPKVVNNAPTNPPRQPQSYGPHRAPNNNLQTPKATIPEKRHVPDQISTSKRQSIDNEDAFDDSLIFSDDLNLESEDFNDEVNHLLDTKRKTPEECESKTGASSQANIRTNCDIDRPQDPQQSVLQVPSIPPNNPEQELTNSQVGFFTARVAEQVQKNSVTNEHAFNPQFISPSIRRTVDPTKSTPIKRSQVAEPKSVRYDNPRLNPNRQVGRPRYPVSRKSGITGTLSESNKENSNNSG